MLNVSVKKITALMLSILLFVGMMPTVASAATIDAPADENFTVLWTTDPQWYSFAYPEIIEHQNQWVIENYSRMDMRYIIHTGDFVDNPHSTEQWAIMDAVYAKWDQAGLAYGILAGNHDVDGSDHTEFSTYFGKARYENNAWYGGDYDDNFGHYDLMTFDGVPFIFVYLGYNSSYSQADYDWLNSVLKQYPNHLAVLSFHEYLAATGQRTPNGEAFFQNVVLKNPNVRMVLCGHNYNSTRKVEEIDDNGDGKADRTLYQMMANYQSTTNGGNGFMRFMEFDIGNGKIISRTYSPYIEKFGSDYEDGTVFDEYGYRDEFTMPFDFSAPVAKADGDPESGSVVVSSKVTFGVTDTAAPVTLSLNYQNVAEDGTVYQTAGAYDRFFSLNAADAFVSPESLNYVVAEYVQGNGYTIQQVVKGTSLSTSDPFVAIPQNSVVIALAADAKDEDGNAINIDTLTVGRKVFLNRAVDITTPSAYKGITLSFNAWGGKYNVDGKNRLTGNGEWVIYDNGIGDSTADTGYTHTWDLLFAFSPVSGSTYRITAVDTQLNKDKDMTIPSGGFVLAVNTYFGGHTLRDSLIENMTAGIVATLYENTSQTTQSILPSAASGWSYDSALVNVSDGSDAQVFYKVSGSWPSVDYNLPSSITVDPSSFALNYDYCIETSGKANIILFFKNSNASSYISEEWCSIQSNFSGAVISANSGDVKGDDVRRTGKINLSAMNIPSTCYNDDGTLTINAIRVMVSGEVNKKIYLYDLSVTNDICDSDVAQSIPLMDPSAISIVDDGRSGSYTYHEGVLEVRSDTENGFEVDFALNKAFNVSLLKNLLIDLDATTRFDIRLIVTTSAGESSYGLVSEFCPRFCTAADNDHIPAGQYAMSLDLESCYTWNTVLPADGVTTVKTVRVMVGGAGTLTVNALQMSNTDKSGYFADGVSKTAYSKALLNTTYPTDNGIISEVVAGTSVTDFLAAIQSDYTLTVTENGVPVSGDSVVKTGQVLTVTNGSQTLIALEISVFGDYDRNGVLATLDARAVLRKLLETPLVFSDLEVKTADVNKDGVVNTRDARALLLILVS